MGGVIVEYHPYPEFRWIVGVGHAQEFDEFGTAMAVAHQAQNLSGQKVDASQQRKRAMTDVLVITPYSGVPAGDGRQIGSCVLDGLNPWLLIVGQYRYELRRSRAPVPQLDLLVDMQHLSHLVFKFRIPPFQVVAELVRLDLNGGQNLRHRSSRQALQTGMTGRHTMLADVLRQQSGR